MNRESLKMPVWIKRLPQKVKSKDEALQIVLNHVKKLGKRKVLEIINKIDAFIGSNGMLAEKTADSRTSSLNDLIRRLGYPVLISAVLFLYVTMGKPFMDNLKKNMERLQEKRIEQIEQIAGPVRVGWKEYKEAINL